MNGPAMLRTFLVFFVGGLLTATAVISLVLSGGIIWFDCLHDNPGHVCGDALLFTAISPFYGPFSLEQCWPSSAAHSSITYPCGT